jgi:PTH2 family peptidyl-tRNA hydrolase
MVMVEYKQVIVIRSDLKLSKGKLSVQAAHASLEAYKKADKRVCSEWESSGSKKVVVKIEDLKGLMEIYEEAKKAGLPTSLIKDAGRTELPPGTITSVCIGPAHEKDIDKITGKLKMM